MAKATSTTTPAYTRSRPVRQAVSDTIVNTASVLKEVALLTSEGARACRYVVQDFREEQQLELHLNRRERIAIAKEAGLNVDFDFEGGR